MDVRRPCPANLTACESKSGEEWVTWVDAVPVDEIPDGEVPVVVAAPLGVAVGAGGSA